MIEEFAQVRRTRPSDDHLHPPASRMQYYGQLIDIEVDSPHAGTRDAEAASVT